MRERTLLTKRIALCFIMAIALAVMLIPVGSQNGAGKVYAASPITAGCSGVKRTSATQATAWVYSDTAGSIYYLVDEQSTTEKTASQIVSTGTMATETVAADSIAAVGISVGMYSGEMYAHIVVVDSEDANNVSSVMTIGMPIEYMASENFEAYPAGFAKNNSLFNYYDNGTIYDDSGNKVYRMYGNNYTSIAGHLGVQNFPFTTGMENGKADTVIMEGRVKTGADTPEANFGLTFSYRRAAWVYIGGYVAGVAIKDGKWYSTVYVEPDSEKTEELDLATGNVSKDTWYSFRIVYDTSLNEYDVYIDGKKANSEPITGFNGQTLTGYYVNSATGKYTFYDDICLYSYPSQLVDDATVKFNLPTANYIDDQSITLSTGITGLNIYYTMDGSYPNPTSGSASTMLYNESTPIEIGYDTDDDHSTTIRALACIGTGAGFKAYSVAYEETYTFVTVPELAETGILRDSDTNLYMWLLSNVDGDIYYKIDKTDITPTANEIFTTGTKHATSVKQNTTAKLQFNSGISQGATNIYMIVADKDDKLSKVYKISIPDERCLYENFEEYNNGAKSGEAIFGLNDNITIDNSTGSQAIKIQGDNLTYRGTAYKGRIHILEGDMYLGENDSTAVFAFCDRTGYRGANIGIYVKDGEWGYVRQDSEFHDLDLINTKAVKDTWYKVRIVIDRYQRKADLFIDGKRANSESVDVYYDYNRNEVFLQSSAGNTVYFDNIKAYSPTTDYPTVDNKEAIIFSQSSRTYTSDLNIKLSTSAKGRVIHYTTDGSYPENKVGGSTKLYDDAEGVTISGKNVTLRAIAVVKDGAEYKAESTAWEETYTYLSSPTITGESYNRHEVTTAYSWFFSDAKGKAYYTVNDSDTKLGLEEIKRISDVNANTVFDVEENKVTSIKMTQGMAQGEKYAHIIVEDQEGNSSNELVLHMPYDNMRYDSFTEFPAGTGSVGSVYNNKSGSGSVLLNFNDNRKTVTDPTDPTNKVYAVTGVSGSPEHNGTQLGSYTDRSTIILEGRWMSQDTKPSAYFAYGLRYNQGICIEDGVWKSLAGIDLYNVTTAKKEEFDNAANLPVYAPNKWYSLRIVYDYKMKVFDAYIDGIKANDKPIELGTTTPQNDIMASSLGTTTSYFDDIVFYTLPYEASGNITLKDSIVSFSPTSRTYTSEQKISLSTNGANKDIYYAIDGKYPNPTASGTSTGTEKYDDTDKFTIDKKTTTVRAIAGYTAKVSGADRFFAESVAHDETYTYLSEGPKINGQSISRTTESNVYVWFYSDSAGKAYYKVTESADPVEGTNLKTYITENNYTAYNVLENKVNAVKMTEGMSTGKKYAHVIVEDKEGNFSNELIYEMPYDRFRYDDFEEFKNGTKVKDATVLNTNNVLDSNYLVYGYSDKAMNVTDPTDPANNVYKVTGTYPAALNGNSYYGLGGTGNGTIVLEGRMMSELSSPTAYFAFGDWWNEGVCLKDGVWSSIAGVDGNVDNAEILKFDNADEVTYSPDTWFTIRIVYDIDKGVFDAYVEGVKMNNAPIKVKKGFRNHISLGASGTTSVYYDDIIHYAFRSGTNRDDSVVTFKPESGKYSKEQYVELATAQEGRIIYYTTDGSYPNPDLSKAGNTTKIYDAEAKIKVENGDTTITALAGIKEDGKFKAESVAYSADYSITGAPVISGNSVYRESATKATVWLKSDIAGEVYYKASESDTAPQVDNDTLDDNWRKADSDVEADKTMSIAVTKDMSIRAKYIYVVVKDADGSFSNVLSYKMPYEFYFFDDCEASIMDTNEVFGSWGKYERYEKEPGKDNMIYAYRYAAQDMFNLPYVSAGNTIIFEAKVMSDYDNATLGLGCGNDYQAMIYTENGKWYVYNGKGNKTELDNMSSKGFVSNTWYSIKIEYSIKEVERTINVYIDDELANSSPINCVSTSGKNTVCMQGVSYTSDTSQSAYFDDITWYVDVSKVENATSPKVVRNLVYSGENQTGITYDKNLASYTITANNATADDETGVIYAKEAGNYSATFTLRDGYVWADGTKAPKTLSWSIAKKPVTIATKATKVYNGNDDATIEVDTTVGYKGITGIVDADLTEIEAETKNISVTPESATGYYIDKYAGIGKSITLESADAFTITGTGSENYVVDEQEITGDITPAVQTIAKARTLQAGVNDIITDNQLKTAVKGAKGTLSFEITDGSEYASYTAGTGLVINENANGKTIKVKATAAAGDLNGDDIPEYAANIEGVVFDVVVNSKESQTVIFAKPSLSVVYGKTGEGQTAEVIVDDGETAGAVTYSIDDPADLSVITVDKTTGTITTVGVGTATVTATAAATSKYNQATASYTVTVTEAPQAAPNVGKKDESVAGKKDGALTGLTTDMEYRTDGETTYKAVTADMIKDGTLNGLAAGTYYVRIKAKTNYSASADTKVVIAVGGADEKLTFAKSEITATYGDTGVGQKAASNVSDGGAITYSSDNTEVAEVNAATGDVTIKGVGTAKITAVSAATTIYSGSSASYTLTVNKASQKAPSATVKPESIEGVSDGSITGLTSDMEYRKHGETTYTPVTGDSITGLAPGTYYVRVKANKNYEASEDVAVVIAAGKEEDISATITYAENIPVEVKEEVIKKTNTDNKDIDGSISKYLMPKATVKKQTIKLTWNKITGADGYIIYGNLCGKKLERITEITNGNTKSWTAKKLQKGKYYKYVVVAYKTVKSGQQKVITTSKTVHAVTDGGKKGNPTGLKLKKSKITVKVGKKQTIKATLKYKKKVATHVAKFRFESDDPTIATVDYKKGVVKGVKKGKTFIYVFTQNGICKKVTVTVK